MTKQISERLADLSVKAKRAEDNAAAARQEAREKVDARKEQVRTSATAAAQKVDDEIRSFGSDVSDSFKTAQAKVSADMNALKANVTAHKHDRDIKHAENHAERLENEAAYAIDFAIASVEQAELATLDAIIGRLEAEDVKQT